MGEERVGEDRLGEKRVVAQYALYKVPPPNPGVLVGHKAHSEPGKGGRGEGEREGAPLLSCRTYLLSDLSP